MRLVVILTLLLAGGGVNAESVVLHSGDVVQGKLVSATPTNVQIVVGGKTLVYPTAAVASVNFDPPDESSDRGAATAEIPFGSEVTAQVVSVRVTNDSTARVMLQSLEIIRLSNGKELEVGTILEAQLSIPATDNWISTLQIQRALDANTEYSLSHGPIDEVAPQMSESVVYGRGDEAVTTAPADWPDALRESKVVVVSFAEEKDEQNS